jgi:hypothetical protein
MKDRLGFALVLAAWVGVACGGDGARRGEQKAYETVEEGSAAGVTSMIHGPGEVLPPITATNADTTTAFTIDPNVVGAAPAPRPVTAQPEPEREPVPPTETAPPETDTNVAPPEEEPEEGEPPPTTIDTRGQF